MGAANLRALLIRGNYYTSTATTVAAATMTNLVLGRQSGDITVSSGYTYNSRTMRIGFALYPALSQADATTVAASLRTAFSIPTTFDYRVVFSGDSIMEGSGTALNGNVPNQLQPLFAKKAEVFNTGLHGKLMADMYNNRVAFFSTLFAAGVPNVIFLETGTNDLTSTAGVGTTTYNTYTAPLVTYLKGLGFKVVVNTLLPRQDNTNATLQSERTIYNGLVTANSASADYVLDLASNPTMGTNAAANDATLYVDKLHPTKLGDTWLAGAPSGTYANDNTYYHALQQVLGVTP
jgi:lysophospholipase L1-like esterase